MEFVPGSPIDDKSALAEAMAWCWTGNKPFPEPMMIKFCNAIWRHKATMS